MAVRSGVRSRTVGFAALAFALSAVSGVLAGPPSAQPAMVLPELARSIALAEASSALANKDYVNAARYLTTAVGLGDPTAMGNLAFLYAEGLGVPKDDARAMALFQSAVEGGAVISQDKLEVLKQLEATIEQKQAAPAPAPILPAPPATQPADTAIADFAGAERINTARAFQQFLALHPTATEAIQAQADLAKALRAMTAGLSPGAAERPLAANPGLVLRVQTALNAAGARAGLPDAKVGGQTRSAIKTFEANNGMAVTGYLSVDLVERLGVALYQPGDPLLTARPARSYTTADLAQLSTDGRLLKATASLHGRPFEYDYFDGHLYVAVLDFRNIAAARKQAKDAGGYLASIDSMEENDFIFRLVAGDAEFFEWHDEDDGRLSITGPYIGLLQSPQGREPAGGWAWESGEEITYKDWAIGEPNDWNKNEDATEYMAHNVKRTSDLASIKATWGDVPVGGSSGYVIEIP